MTQVFSNIIKNAKDAMQNKGKISVKMFLNENFADVVITDEGIGMDEETLENCFDPLFTTKSTKAVGMGLTVSLQIIEMHGGKIRIETEKGNGCSVYITLPVVK
jgi:signal transduction histidine kinase